MDSSKDINVQSIYVQTNETDLYPDLTCDDDIRVDNRCSFCGPSYRKCWGNTETDHLVCEDGSVSPLPSSDPNFSWSFCTEIGSKRALCPSSNPYMCNSTSSGAGGTDHGCVRFEECFKKEEMGHRPCRSGEMAESVESTCMANTTIVNATTNFNTTNFSTPKIWKLDDGWLTFFIVGPSDKLTSPKDSYQLSFTRSEGIKARYDIISDFKDFEKCATWKCVHDALRFNNFKSLYGGTTVITETKPSVHINIHNEEEWQ
eukprot:UN28752